MANSPKKILFAISDTGGGHRSGAVAIIAALEKNYDVQCTVTDLLRATDFPVLKKAPEIYDYCSKKHLWLNNLFFRKTNSVRRINALTRLVYFQSRRHVERELERIQPDAVIAVHPLVIRFLHMVRSICNANWSIITVITDLVTIHASWASPGADLYLVPTQEAVQALLSHGVPKEKIVYTGFPIHPKFVENAPNQEQARQALGIDPDKFTVLLTGGGVGAGNLSEWVSTFESECHDKQILVVTGNNKELYQTLVANNKNPYLHVYGFVNNMEALMAASDVIVSKAGPGTIMEGIASDRPLIVTEAVGIQETGNIDYVRKYNLGYYCPIPLEAATIINDLAQQSQNNTFSYSNDNVIKDGVMRIADTIMEQLRKPVVMNKPVKRNLRSFFLGA